MCYKVSGDALSIQIMFKDYWQCCTIFMQETSTHGSPGANLLQTEVPVLSGVQLWLPFLYLEAFPPLNPPRQYPSPAPHLSPISTSLCLFPSLDSLNSLGPLYSILCYPYPLGGSELSLGGFLVTSKEVTVPNQLSLEDQTHISIHIYISIFSYLPSAAVHSQDGTHCLPQK